MSLICMGGKGLTYDKIKVRYDMIRRYDCAAVFVIMSKNVVFQRHKKDGKASSHEDLLAIARSDTDIKIAVVKLLIEHGRNLGQSIFAERFGSAVFDFYELANVFKNTSFIFSFRNYARHPL